MKTVHLSLSVLFIFTLIFFINTASASKKTSEISDRPFKSMAVISKKCRDVNISFSKPDCVKHMYQKEDDRGSVISEMGILYLDDHENATVCLDDLTVNPFVEKNVEGKKVSVSGVVTSGKEYGTRHDEILVIDSLELEK